MTWSPPADSGWAKVVAGGGASRPPALRLPPVTDFVISAQDNGVTSMTDEGDGWTEFVVAAAGSADTSDPTDGDAFFVAPVDVQGNNVVGQQHLYRASLWLEVDRVLDPDVQVGLVWLEGSLATNVRGYGVGMYGITGGLNGPVALTHRTTWQTNVSQETTKGDATARFVGLDQRMANNSSGINGYIGSGAWSKATPGGAKLRFAEYTAETGGAAPDSFNLLALVVGTRAAIGADATFRVRAYTHFELHQEFDVAVGLGT